MANEIILSTGMSDLDEIKNALKALSFGIMNLPFEACNSKLLTEAYKNFNEKKLSEKRVKLLHCTTEYPAPFDEVNLNAMQTLKKKFDLDVGYSDHTMGINTSLAAVALGASIIEKHFTLNKFLKGPDHIASLNPKELKLLVKGIREVEKTLGHRKKIITSSEKKNINIARKFLVASNVIKKGEKFSENNITSKRSGGGISPFEYWKILKNKAKKSYNEDDIIDK